MKVKILGSSEMRWKGAGCITSDGYKILYSGGEHHYRGVSVLLDPETSRNFGQSVTGPSLLNSKVNLWTLASYNYMYQLQTETKKNLKSSTKRS